MNDIEILNDLIKVNNDRIAGYKKASVQTTDETLQKLFFKLANQSEEFLAALEPFVKAEGIEPASGTTLAGKIYRLWMDVNAAFSGEDQESLVTSCLMGENAALDAYLLALEDNDLQPDVLVIIEQQKVKLQESYDTIKGLLTTVVTK